MSSVTSPIEQLPNELLDEIIFHLSTCSPSSKRLHNPPQENITQSRDRDLKNLSLTCSRFLDVVRPRLFSHGCFRLADLHGYLSFISGSDLGRHVTSVVVKASDDTVGCEGSGVPWWQSLLRCLRPLRLTVIAPPASVGRMLGIQIPEDYSWAFEIPFQVLHLERDHQALDVHVDEQADLQDCLPWSSMLFNESSSIKSYSHYEYFLYQVPSLFHRSTLAYTQVPLKQPHLSFSPKNLTSFTYVAVFPVYNHVQIVLDAVALMANLRSLKTRLASCQGDRAAEREQRGSMDPSDPWMELATGYTLIAHAVRNLGRNGCLSEFTACDYEREGVRAEIDAIFENTIPDDSWAHNGLGVWTKKLTKTVDNETAISSRCSITCRRKPASPILAHTLLQPPETPTNIPGPRVEGDERPEQDPDPSEAWDLSLDIENGFHSSPDRLFCSGTVIGFSKLRAGESEGNEEVVGELPRYLLTEWLRKCNPPAISPSTAGSQPINRAFIIHLANFTAFSPEKLLSSLLSHGYQHQQPLSRTQAISHLDSVHLFPVFDFTDAVQAINEVSNTLLNTSQSPQRSSSSTKTILIIAGLDTLTEAVIRASNALRGTAVLVSTLRTLSHLSRTYPSTLSVVLVNTSGVGPMIRDDDGGRRQAQSQYQPQREYYTQQQRDGGIQSIFSITDTPLFPTLLMRTLDQGVDTHLLVSRTRGVPVVEVVKDRVGNGIGRWCVWAR
ncbi:hypothetical protein BJX99DRAFT_245055 [Aspergillus californicus]